MAMGSPCELLIESNDQFIAKRLVQVVADEAWRIEDKFSRYLPGNIIDRINRSNGNAVETDKETAGLLDYAAALTDMSEGGFDITSGVLREIWKFDGSDNLPDSSSVNTVLEQVGWHRVDWSRPQLTIQPGMQIDLGGIGKEYAVDKAAGLLRDQTDVPCLINFGGDIILVVTYSQLTPALIQVAGRLASKRLTPMDVSRTKSFEYTTVASRRAVTLAASF